MNIKIPQKLEAYLVDDSKKWSGCVSKLQALLDPILSGAPSFFPEYTDHGFRHVNTVLEQAAELIPGKPLGEPDLTPRDAACLIAAILIHDLGMFVEPSGMQTLLDEDWDNERITELDEQSWRDAWEQYLSGIRRMPDAQKRRCFGTVVRAEDVTLEEGKMVRRDQLVIGEFLRRNHPRLAHEIAVQGLPGSTTQYLLRDAGFDETTWDVIGLMARSHGMALRKVEDYLGSGSDYSNVPVYYLMSILRLADLLDASEERAPMIRLKLTELTSPLSDEEWALNQCFRLASGKWDDKTKNYTVDASPKTSSEYARLEKWLNNVQLELDLCWSILAQKYPDSGLKLSIHRVLCTMHEPVNIKRIRREILPREVRVTANPEIVKLMMEPLYGDDPTYGVRELLQNAVDACLERREWERRQDNPNYEGLVDIRIDGNTFTITDNGMGMNEDILLNYYLCAGSSYRDSESWKAENAPDGKSRVARTGKFGVGFLAAFLLGDKIEVHTQHRSDERGMKLAFTRESMPLDVKRKRRSNPFAPQKGDPTGTTITIEMKEGVRGELMHPEKRYWQNGGHWCNWYAFDDPRVEYRVDGRQYYHRNLSISRETENNTGWFNLPSDDFESYQWSPNMEGWDPEFYCNGIRVYDCFGDDLELYGLWVPTPHVSVIDQNGRLDVDLARKTLKSVPEENALRRELCRFHIARLLRTRWDTEELCRRNFTQGSWIKTDYNSVPVPFLLSRRGFALSCDSLTSAFSPEGYVLLYYAGEDAKAAIRTAAGFLEGDTPYLLATDERTWDGRRIIKAIDHHYKNRAEAFAAKLFRTGEQGMTWEKVHYMMYNAVNAVWCSGIAGEGIPEKLRERYEQKNLLTADGPHSVYVHDQMNAMPIDPEHFPISQFPVAVHVSFERKDNDSIFTRVLKEILTPAEGYDPDDYWIPFDMAERRKKFPKAFKDLKVYLDYLEEHPEE